MRYLAALLSLSLGATLVGCGSDSVVDPSADTFVGVYTLRTVNGQTLPVDVPQAGDVDRIEWTHDTLTINPLGSPNTFTRQEEHRLTNAGIVSTASTFLAGNYSRSGAAVTFEFGWDDASNGTGTIGINKITVQTAVYGVPSYTLVYQK